MSLELVVVMKLRNCVCFFFSKQDFVQSGKKKQNSTENEIYGLLHYTTYASIRIDFVLTQLEIS